MRLKKIKVAGFKTFVDPQSLSLPTQMTCVVGPNGCGKSNVIDAVRWVLGESSAKNLRGQDSTDVIFNGSSSRKASSRASVELIFENCEGRLSGSMVQRHELSVKRVVSSDGKSTYFLNGDKCRKKDVTNVFLGTGLGPRSYAIIEQGMISRLIESKPDELRVFLEEAAGISKYKERRREAESRLSSTEANLSRLDDVRFEIDKSLEKLLRDSAKARRFKLLKSEQRALRGELAYLSYIDEITAHDSAQAERDLLEKDLSDRKSDALVWQQKIDVCDSVLAEYQESIDRLVKQGYEYDLKIGKLEQQGAHEVERNERFEAQMNKLTFQLANKSSELKEVDRQLVDAGEFDSSEMADIEEELSDAKKGLSSLDETLSNVTKRWESLMDESAESLSNKRVCSNEIVSLSKAIERSEAQKASLIASKDSEEGTKDSFDLPSVLDSINIASEELSKLQYSREKLESASDLEGNALARVTKDLDQSNDKIRSIKSRLDSLLFLQGRQEKANEGFDAWLDNEDFEVTRVIERICMDSTWQLAGESVLSWLCDPLVSKDNPLFPPDFRASWASLSVGARVVGSLAEKVLSDEFPALFNFIGVSREHEWFVCVDDKGRIDTGNWGVGGDLAGSGYFERKEEIANLERELGAAESLYLSQCDGRRDHEVLLADLKKQIVDLDVRINDSRRSIAVLESEQKSALSFAEGRRKRLADFEDKIGAVVQELDGLKVSLSAQEKLQVQLDEVKFDERVLDDLKNEKAKLGQGRNVASASIQSLQSNLHEVKLDLERHYSRIMSLNGNKRQLSLAIEDLEGDIAELGDTATDCSEERVRAIQKDIEVNLERKLTGDAELLVFREKQATQAKFKSDAEGALSARSSAFSELAEQVSDKLLVMERHKVKAEGFVQEIEGMGQSLKDLEKATAKNATASDWSLRLNALTNKINGIGTVNLASIEECGIVQARKEHLDAQDQDLRSAVDTLRGVIAKIDADTRGKFKETFEKVNAGLSELFPKVFGGGSAELTLTEGDLLTAGVQIMARPPGKKNATIQLLSGGEKALTALSLVFSIFQLNPAPFCMLDEVDAPLDDVNVGRFCRLVDGMSDAVQFIYISHNKVSMEMSKQMSGVTMKEPGVSRIVSVNIDEVSSMVV